MFHKMVNAYNLLFDKAAFDVVIRDKDLTQTFNARVAPANLFRNFSGPEDSIVQGFEFIITVKEVEKHSGLVIERGVRIIDSAVGTKANNTIVEVRPVRVLKELVAYRVRTG